MSEISLSRSSSIYSTPPQTPSTTPPPFVMCTDFLPNLSKDLSLLLSETEDYNMIINVGEYPNTKQFKVHSIILRVRSSYFRAALSSEWAKVENNYITFNKPNIDPRIFEIILNYIYTGTIILDENIIIDDTISILDVMIAADELCLQELIDYAQDYLLLYKHGWIQRNFITTHKIALEHSNTFTKLLNHCNEIIMNDPELVFSSQDFNSIDENTLISLLKRDDLLKNEIELWNHLINWGVTNANLSKDLSKWSIKDYSLLSKKIEKSINHIRFLLIPSGDFYKRVKPFANSLPLDLYEDILQYHLVPDHQPSKELSHPIRVTIDSILIDRKYSSLIASWIDGKDKILLKDDIYCFDNPYEFKLLLRGSRDGFTGIDFHKKCDSKSATVTIMKISNTGELIGGFTPINWSSKNEWGYTNESFIFYLGEKSIVSRVRDPTKAINFYQNYGPAFGRDDLKMAGNFKNELRCHCKQSDYEYPIRNDTDNFSIDEYEVFQIIPRRPNLMNLI